MSSGWQKTLESIIMITSQQFSGFSSESFILSCIVGLAVVYGICRVMELRCGERFSNRTIITMLWLAIYLCFVLQITILNRESLSRGGMFFNLYLGALNGSYLELQQAVYTVLNIVLFLPIGFSIMFLRHDSGWLRSTILVTMYCFVVSITIESIQYVTGRGYFELTDLLTNTLGGFIGGMLAMILLSVKKRFERGRCRNEE